MGRTKRKLRQATNATIAREARTALRTTRRDLFRNGTHPAFTTAVGRSSKDSDFEELRTALVNAEIRPRDDKRRVSVAVET